MHLGACCSVRNKLNVCKYVQEIMRRMFMSVQVRDKVIKILQEEQRVNK